ncbi:MAG: hypothetical protein KJ804_20675 [Proteobacteria bacterium]|nr:hypothetical protein [Pseudomonadota bacterium]
MIVKIKRYDDKEDFLLVDNIQTLHKAFTKYNGPLGPNDVLVQDCDPLSTMIKLACVKNDGSEISVIFDTTAYILNDSGKTIECIVANNRLLQNK